jgi:hypothetical protein
MTGAEPASGGEPTRAGLPARTTRPTRYRYVDFAARAQPGFRNHVVAVEEVPGLVERWGAEECYASIFRLSADILVYLAEHLGVRAALCVHLWLP